MRLLIICSQRQQGDRKSASKARGVLGLCKLPFCDLRLVAIAAMVILTLKTLPCSEPVQKIAHPQVARGEEGVQIMSFALAPANARLVTTNTAGRIALRSAESGWKIERFLDFPGYARDATISPDGRFVAAVGIEPGVWVWDLETSSREPTERIPVSIERARYVRYSPDGRSLVVASDLDGTIIIWDLASRRERMVLHQLSVVVRVAFSPDGRWLATAGMTDWSIQVWDMQSGSQRVLQEKGPGAIMALAFSRDGAFLASAGFPEHHIRLWDLKTQQVCRVLAADAHSLHSVAFSPDGSLLAAAGNDGMLRLWTVATAERRLSFDSKATCPRTVDFSPDGQTLMLASDDDDDVRLWNHRELLATSITKLPEEGPLFE